MSEMTSVNSSPLHGSAVQRSLLTTTPKSCSVEPTFHSKTILKMPTLPLKSDSIFGTLWRSLPQHVRLAAYSVLVWMGKKLYGTDGNPFGSTTQCLPFNLFCKHRADINEVLATMFISENTTIPVPKILDIIDMGDSSGELFVLMTRLPGTKVLENLSELDSAGHALMEADLRDWLFQLRSLRPPSSAVTGFPDGPCWQYSILANKPIGPFDSTDKFHEFLLSRVWGEERESVLELSPKSFAKHHRICFTHGDLLPRNVLIHKGRLSGLVDWATAGWYPEYWERVSGSYIVHDNWTSLLGRVLPQYEEELEVQLAIWDVDSTHPMCS